MTHIQGTFLAGAIALAALSVPSSAQATLQGLGTSIPNLTVTDMSPDGSALVATDGSSIYVWTTGNPTFTLASSGGGWDCRVSNGGAYISSTRPDPVTGNDTPARLDVSTGQWLFLGGLGGQSGTSIGSAYDINGDGQVVVGLGWISATNAHAFRWDPINGMIDLGTLQGGSDSRANGVSADGATVVGWDSDPNTGVWRAARWVNGVENLLGCLDPADPINGPSESYAASSNGAYVVGESSTGLYTPSFWDERHAFRWDALNGLIDLGTTTVDPFGWGTHSTTPAGISDDGRTLVGLSGAGFFGQQVFISREGSPMDYLQSYLAALGVPQAASWTFAGVAGISADGRVICGTGYNPSFVSEPYRVELPPIATIYCTAKTNSLGCVPAIATNGSASVSSGLPFEVSASNVLNNRNGLLYYGYAPFNAPFQGGTKCVASPTLRTPLQNAGGAPSGNSCTGAYSFDFNAHIDGGSDALLVAGAVAYCQYWSRDPQSPSTTGLTNAASFTVFP